MSPARAGVEEGPSPCRLGVIEVGVHHHIVNQRFAAGLNLSPTYKIAKTRVVDERRRKTPTEGEQLRGTVM